MFGFLFGVACLGGLFLYMTREERGDRRHQKRRMHRRFRRFALRRVYDSLDTSPSQEQVIEDAIRKLERESEELRGQMRNGRFEVARALRNETLDREALEQLGDKQQAAIQQLKTKALDAISEVHAVLDPRQRSLLSELISEGHHCGGRHHRGHRFTRHWARS